MNYRKYLIIIIFLLLANCTTQNVYTNKHKINIIKGFSNKGFALVYDEMHYDNGLISKKIDERSLIIFQKNIKTNSHVKITNISNNKSLIAKVGPNADYPLFYNSVLSKRITIQLDLDIKEPYVEITEILDRSIFIAKKAKTYQEERNVAIKVPVNIISINDLNKNILNKKKFLKKEFSYEIKIADFYYNDTAKMMIDRIVNETEIKNPKIKKLSIEKYRVYLGPFDNINSLQKSYNDINILEFDNIEIIKND